MSENTSPPSMNDLSVFCSDGSEQAILSDADIKFKIRSFLKALGPREDVIILPPDYTRFHSQAGKITRFICEYYNFIVEEEQDEEKGVVNRSKQGGEEDDIVEKSNSSPKITILPALGTHVPMTEPQIKSMFGGALASKQPSPFLIHDWRKDVVTIGHVPSSMVCLYIDSCFGTIEDE